MRQLLEIEWLTYSRYRTMQIVLGLYVVFMIGTFLSFEAISIGPFELFTNEAFRFPYVWQNVGFLAKLLNLYLGIAIILMVSNEFTYGTLKQHIIDGLSRRQIVLAKSLTVVLLSIVSTLLLIVIGTVLGISKAQAMSVAMVFDRADFILAHFVHAFGVLSMAMMIAFLLERNGLAVILFISYAVFGEAIIRSVIDLDFVQYFPMRNFTMLNLYPYIEVIPENFEVIPDHVDPVRLLLGLFYAVIFHCVSWIKIKGADLK